MNTKSKILITLFSILMNISYAQVKDTITMAYVSVQSYEIDYSTIKKIESPKISDYQGSYRFGESEGESQLEIIYSNGKLYALTEYYDWEQDNWILKRDREPIKYINGKIEIGKSSYELYECVKTNYLTLNEGDKVLVSHSIENINNKIYHFVQVNINSEIKVPKGKYPETSFVKLSDSDLTTHTKYDLKIMRNEIFARNGYIFKKGSEMDAFFSKQEWYNSMNKTNNLNLDAIEKHNVSLISKFEQEFRMDKTNLGEDIAEINCYVKKIYKKDNLTFVDIDIVQIKCSSEGGERYIINENPNIRTYIVDDSTIIYTHDCGRITPEKLTEIEKSVLDDKSIIVVGSAKDGILKSINFGCYE